MKLILLIPSNLGPTEEGKCKGDEAKEELMKETITSASDSTEDHRSDVPEEQGDNIINTSGPKSAVSIPSEGIDSKPSKKVYQ